MGKRKSQPQIATQTSAPWSNQIPYLNNLFYTAEGLRSIPAQFYHGQTYAGFQPEEMEAMNRVSQRARMGSPDVRLLQNQARGILNSDPEMMRTILGPRVGQLLPQLQGQGQRAGMANSSVMRGLEQELVQRELSKLRSEAQNTLMSLRGEEYADLARLAGVGEVRRDMEQDRIDELMARHEFAQMEPWNRLDRFARAIQGGYGTSGETQNFPIRGSRLSGLLGGGLGGAALGGQIGGMMGAGGGAAAGAATGSTFGPYGALIGGLLGAGAGLF